jgi:Ca-activated chloride channel homolog
MKKNWTTIMVALALACALFITALPAAAGDDITEGTLQIRDKEGKLQSSCPLKHTDVSADISGFIARVTVKQQFHNPMKEKIEAIYIFPLPSRAAVDDMTMKVGSRTIKGDIKKKEEAKKIYEAAKQKGQVASLLEQERPNIFTQSVANIMPGEEVDITISYVEYLNYQDGTYEFSFPMVVGPRYIPGKPVAGNQGIGWADNTDQVPDASRITPPVTPKGTRAGHDISLKVSLDAGVPVQKIRSVLHKVSMSHQEGSPKATVVLDQGDSIPNKDFILQYDVAGNDIQDALLFHTKKGMGGFFSLILQPPLKPRSSQITPKEMIFVIDTSGSQMGWPIEKAKETMKYCIENMNEGDTFNLMAFSNHVDKLFASPMANSKENREKALDYLAHRLGSGGTEMLPAVNEALQPRDDPQRLRIVCFMTDGYVGNDMQVIDAIKKNIGNARFFSFGVGNSVNRYLLDKMAEMGRGEVEYVTLNRHGDEVAEAFQRKIGTPLLTDIKMGWGNLSVSETYPRRSPDLFSGKPVIITGRYKAGGRGEIKLMGKCAGKPYERIIKVNFPDAEPSHDVLASLWARTKVEDLMDQDLSGIQSGQPKQDIKEEITKLGLAFRLMTQYTSFVAVEEKVITEGGVPKTVAVPVEMPDGVSYEGIFGDDSSKDEGKVSMNRRAKAYSESVGPTVGSGGFGGPASTFSKAPAQPMPTTAPMKSQASYRSGGRLSTGSEETDGFGMPVKNPVDKIDASLKGLAKRVASEGQGGTLALKGFEVRNGRVQLIVTVTHVSKHVQAKLKNLGFITETSSATYKVIRGSIGVDKIDELSKCTFVEKIEPYISGRSGKTSMHEGGSLLLFVRPCAEAIASMIIDSKFCEKLIKAG